MQGLMHSEAAETFALKGLAFVVADEGLLSAFLNLSGLEPDDLRARAGEPELLAAVIDFLLSDDARLALFCEAEETTAQKVHAARRALPGWHG